MTGRHSDYSRGVIDDFTRGAPELRFLLPDRSATVLQAYTSLGDNAGFSLYEEGEEVGFLMFAWLKRVVARRHDKLELFTVHRRTDFTSRARVGAESIRRAGRAYVSASTSLSPAATGVLTGPHGEVIVRAEPVDRELIRCTFAPAAAPETKAVMIGIALLYLHDLTR